MPRLFLLFFFLASILLLRFISFYHSQPIYRVSEEISLKTALQVEPEISNKGQQFSIKTPTNQLIFVKSEVTPRLHYGQVISVSGKLQKRDLPNGNELLVLYYPKISVIRNSEGPLFQAAQFIREKSKKLFEKSLPPISASLLSGIVFGSKEHFPSDFKKNLSNTGVLHVIAASGMNISFVVVALLFIFNSFMRRQIALLFGILGIIFYLFLVGFEPSIIRASLMAILAFGAGILGRQNLAIFTIFLTGYLMLLWKPAFLFDVGFQLSFMATLGILLSGGLGRFGESGDLGKLSNIRNVLKESMSTTLAAQIATLPILLGVFGSFGILSPLVNALILWTVPILMILGSVSILIGFIFIPLGQVLLFFALPLLLFFETVISFFGGLGWNLTVDSFPWQMSVGYYLILVAVAWKIKYQKVKSAH